MRLVNGFIGEPSGAVIEITVGVDAPREELLKKHGMAVPPSLSVRAQIDTGSSISAIDPYILGKHQFLISFSFLNFHWETPLLRLH